MKYELMRTYYDVRSKQIVLDLYNMHEGQGVELRFYKRRFSQKQKMMFQSYIDRHRINRNLYTLNEWNEIYMNNIKQISEEE